MKNEKLGQEISLPLNASVETLTKLIATLLPNTNSKSFSFFHKNYQVQKNLKELLVEFQKQSITREKTIQINYLEESIFDVRPITRISSSLEGHTEAVLDVQFSNDCKYLASVSGDKTMRIWDTLTETSFVKLEGHQSWVMGVSWSLDSKKLVSSDLGGNIFVWEMEKIIKNKKQVDEKRRDRVKMIRKHELEEKHLQKKIKDLDHLEKFINPNPEEVAALKKEISQLNKNQKCMRQVKKQKQLKVHTFELRGHSKFITAMAWKPFHLDPEQTRMVSSSKDLSIRIWDVVHGKCIRTCLKHQKSVTKVIWSGENLIYSIGQDQ